jgi:hypothetical protein
MSRTHVAALFALSAFALPGSPLLAQKFERGPEPLPRAQPGAVNERDNVTVCGTSGGGTRIRESNCEVETTTLRTEMELKLSIEIPAIPSAQCAATTTTEYQQRNTAAHVDGTLEILDCAAAAGTFKVAVRVKDDAGNERALEFDEVWQRTDDQDVSFTADYPIGESAELVSVRVRGLTCTCADPPEVVTGDSNP